MLPSRILIRFCEWRTSFARAARSQIELFRDELERLRLKRGDLISRRRQRERIRNREDGGMTGRECYDQNHLIRIRPHDEIVPEFLAYY